MTIKAIVTSTSQGYDNDQIALREAGIVVGDEFEVTKDDIRISLSRTSLNIKEKGRAFNAANFRFEEKGKPLDIFSDKRFNSYI